MRGSRESIAPANDKRLSAQSRSLNFLLAVEGISQIGNIMTLVAAPCSSYKQ
jgi:hypothetical protein